MSDVLPFVALICAFFPDPTFALLYEVRVVTDSGCFPFYYFLSQTLLSSLSYSVMLSQDPASDRKINPDELSDLCVGRLLSLVVFHWSEHSFSQIMVNLIF